MLLTFAAKLDLRDYNGKTTKIQCYYHNVSELLYKNICTIIQQNYYNKHVKRKGISW